MELVDWVPFSNRGVMDTFDRSFTSHKASICFSHICERFSGLRTWQWWTNSVWLGFRLIEADFERLDISDVSKYWDNRRTQKNRFPHVSSKKTSNDSGSHVNYLNYYIGSILTFSNWIIFMFDLFWCLNPHWKTKSTAAQGEASSPCEGPFRVAAGGRVFMVLIWGCLKMRYIAPNGNSNREGNDNDKQFVFWGTKYFQTHP